jgi:hypothetical protein
MTNRAQELKDIIDDVDALDLPDGAYWAMINERFTGDPTSVVAQDMIASNPEYFGWS